MAPPQAIDAFIMAVLAVISLTPGLLLSLTDQSKIAQSPKRNDSEAPSSNLKIQGQRHGV
jgi:hypothetical protein